MEKKSKTLKVIIKMFPKFCLGSISNEFGAIVSTEVSLVENVNGFSVDYSTINKSSILGIHKNLMVKKNNVWVYQNVKCYVITLLTTIVNASNHTICVSLNSQKIMTEPTLINLYPNEFTQKLRYCPFTSKLDRCIRSCNTLNDLSK